MVARAATGWALVAAVRAKAVAATATAAAAMGVVPKAMVREVAAKEVAMRMVAPRGYDGLSTVKGLAATAKAAATSVQVGAATALLASSHSNNQSELADPPGGAACAGCP